MKVFLTLLNAQITSTLTGNGTYGFSEDGDQATSAIIGGPRALAIGKSWAIYFADSHNDRVRKIDYNSIITTVSGNGATGYSGDGGLAINA